MLKILNLLIPLVLISTGIISCTNHGMVKKNDITTQQFVHAINRKGKYQKVLPQPEKENMSSQESHANISTIKKPSSTTNTKNEHTDNIAIENKLDHNLSGAKQDQIKLNQIGLAHLALGIAYAERNMIDQAICEFQSATKKNPHHMEPHIQLGIAYGKKGMGNEAKFEFKKAMEIDLNEAVAKIVFNALPVAENTGKQKDLFKAYINLGNAYKKEAKFKKAQMVFEKALALKPEHPMVNRLLSEIYFSLGTSHLVNQEYDSAIVVFNKVLSINPDSPLVKDVLEQTHYKLGINYAKDRKLDKAITEFNKSIEISHNYAKLDKGNFNIINKDKKAISDIKINSGKSYSGQNANETNNNVKKEILHEGEPGRESFQNQMLHEIDVTEEIILTTKNNKKAKEYDQKQAEIRVPLMLSQADNVKELVQTDKATSDTLQLQRTNNIKPETVLSKKELPKEDQDGKLIQENIANEQTVAKKETDASLPKDQSNEGIAIKTNSFGKKAVAKYTTSSNYKVYTYNIIRNYKNKIEINEAIKKYEDATKRNPYDNFAFLNLANAYYCKARYIDDAIATREDTPVGNQNFLVKRFYLCDDTDNEKINNTSSSEKPKSFEKYNIDFPHSLNNMYEEMLHEAIIGYKNELLLNPNSSNALYGLAFSFSLKGSSPGVALKSNDTTKGIFFGY